MFLDLVWFLCGSAAFLGCGGSTADLADSIDARSNGESDAAVDVSGLDAQAPTVAPVNLCPQSGWCVPQGLAGGPGPRVNHSAVWTGTEMIVWGGLIGNSVLPDGYRWNPSTGVWTPMVQGGSVPTARQAHSAVWTGTEMIVWGGSSNQAALSDGYRWSPDTGVWTPLVQSGSVPPASGLRSAVWTGTEMIVWGGSGGTSVLADGYLWNAATGVWVPMVQRGSVPSARSAHRAVWTGSEMIVWGGSGGNSFLADGYVWNPVNGDWRPMAQSGPVPAGRYAHSAVWTGAGLVVWGGSGETVVVMRDGSQWNPGSGAWTSMAQVVSAPSPRWGHTAVWTGTEMIVWGGGGGFPGGPFTGAVWRP